MYAREWKLGNRESAYSHFPSFPMDGSRIPPRRYLTIFHDLWRLFSPNRFLASLPMNWKWINGNCARKRRMFCAFHTHTAGMLAWVEYSEQLNSVRCAYQKSWVKNSFTIRSSIIMRIPLNGWEIWTLTWYYFCVVQQLLPLRSKEEGGWRALILKLFFLVIFMAQFKADAMNFPLKFIHSKACWFH